MTRFRALLSFTVLALLLCASSALAKRHNANGFSIETPAGWTYTQEEAMSAFASPGDEHFVSFLITKYEKPNLDAVIREQAGESEVRKLPNGRGYMYEDPSGARAWGMLTKDGLFCEISSRDGFDGIKAMLASLKPGKDSPSMAQIIEVANSPEVVAWLSFADGTPENGKAEGGSSGDGATTPFSGNGITASVPAGWKVSVDGGTVNFLSPDQQSGIVTSIFPLKKSDHKGFVDAARQIAKGMNAVNIREAEGNVEFKTKEGHTGIFSQYGKKGLLILLIGKETDAMNALMFSIAAE